MFIVANTKKLHEFPASTFDRCFILNKCNINF